MYHHNLIAMKPDAVLYFDLTPSHHFPKSRGVYLLRLVKYASREELTLTGISQIGDEIILSNFDAFGASIMHQIQKCIPRAPDIPNTFEL